MESSDEEDEGEEAEGTGGGGGSSKAKHDLMLKAEVRKQAFLVCLSVHHFP